MKNSFRFIFGMVFVFCFLFSLSGIIATIFLLFPLSLHLIPSENELVHYAIILVMLASPVGMMICFTSLKFSKIQKVKIEIKPNFPKLLKWLAPKINTFNSATFELKSFFFRIYGESYTSTFRIVYLFLCFVSLKLASSMISPIFDNKVVGFIKVTNAAILLLMGTLTITHIFINRKQTQIKGD